MDNDEYPNEGSFFLPTEPDDQAKERRVEQSKAQAAKPMLEDILAKVNEDIANMNQVSAIQVAPEADPEAFMKAWYGMQQRIHYAQEIKDYLESLLVTTKR